MQLALNGARRKHAGHIASFDEDLDARIEQRCEIIVGLLGQGWSEADNYPGLTHEDIAACLQYASEVLQAERTYPLSRA